MPKYRIFGLSIETDWLLTYSTSQISEETQASVFVNSIPESWQVEPIIQQAPVYQSPYKITKDGESFLSIYVYPTYYLLHYPGIINYFLFQKQIFYQPLQNFSYQLAEACLLSGVLAIWLELHGFICLHASSVVINQSGVVFLSNSGGGKTTLALTMVKAGYHLLSDDILPVQQMNDDFYGIPAFPSMRVWPTQTRKIFDLPDDLPHVDPTIDKRVLPIGTGIFGRFASSPVPLRSIYILERFELSKRNIEIHNVPSSLAAIELLKHSFAARAVEKLGLAKQRFGVLSNLTKNVDLFRLVYSSGVENLHEVQQAILGNIF